MVRTLNGGTNAIQGFRSEMDTEIATAVSDLNDLLNQFKDANTDIVGISTFTRGDNDMVIMTKDGATLFETIPRTVTFQPQAAFSASMTGNAVYVDGLPII